MPALGYVTKQKNGTYKGRFNTLSVNAPIEIVLNPSKTEERQPDYLVFSGTIEVGAGWIRTSQSSGEDYLSLTFADPAFGRRKFYANLGRAVGQDDKDVFAIIWNPD